jgi:putative transcriptional regulator
MPRFSRYTRPRLLRVVAVSFGTLLCALTLIALVALPARSAPPSVQRWMGPPLARAGRSLAGQLLVATEGLEGSPFARTVVYVVRHDAGGAFGLVINRPGPEVRLAPLLREFGLDDRGVTGRIRVHGGGPVEPGRGLVLHSAEYAIAGTERLAGDVALTSHPVVLADIARGTGPRRYRFLQGYAGWRGGQLEDEIDASAWITVPADPDILFDDDYATKWDRATARRRFSI